MSLPKAWLRLPAGLRVAIVLSFAILLTPLFGWFHAPKPAPAKGMAVVRGSIFTPVVENRIGVAPSLEHPAMGNIALANFAVFLAPLNSMEKVASTTTLSDGTFAFEHVPAGEFRLCWNDSGWVSGCDPQNIKAGGRSPKMHPVLALPVIGTGSSALGAVWGQVQFQDHSPVEFSERAFKTRIGPALRRKDSGQASASALSVNSTGTFVAVNVPRGGTQIDAQLESIQTSATVNRDAAIAGGRQDLMLPNRAPVLLEVTPTVGGKKVYEAEPGTHVLVKAKALDADGDQLEFAWSPEAPGSAVNAMAGQAGMADWTLAPYQGLQVLHVMVKDGKGGYATSGVSVAVGGHGVTMTGDVVNAAGKAFANAIVSVGGKVVRTQRDGTYRIHVARARTYPARVSAPGYATVSQVFVSAGRHKPITLAAPKAKAKVQVSPDGRAYACARFLVENMPTPMTAHLVIQDGGTASIQDVKLTNALTELHLPMDHPGTTSAQISLLDWRGIDITRVVTIRDENRHALPYNFAATPYYFTYTSTRASDVDRLKFPYDGCDTISVNAYGTQNGDAGMGYHDLPFLGTYTGYDRNAPSTATPRNLAYYQHLDPEMTFKTGTTLFVGKHGTLADFWQYAGFDVYGKGGSSTRLSYLNGHDLGMGVDLHMRQNAADKTTYAYMYLFETMDGPDGPIIDPTLADTASEDDVDIATVRYTLAMESTKLYTISGAGTKVDDDVMGNTTKFWVYYGGTPIGALIDGADMGLAWAYVPNGCLACHGTSGEFSQGDFLPGDPVPTTVTDVDLARRTLPDPMNPVYNTGPSFLPINLAKITPGTKPPADFLTRLYDLNMMVHDTNAVQPGVKLLIESWYRGGAPRGSVPDTSDPPDGPMTPISGGMVLSPTPPGCWVGSNFGFNETQCLWDDHSAGGIATYRTLYQPVCITCHAATPRFSSTLANGEPRDEIANMDMPHSLMNYRRMWLSTIPCFVSTAPPNPPGKPDAWLTKRTNGDC